VATDLVVSGRGLAASLVLSEQDLRTITGFDGAFETGPLNDEPDTDLYSSQHFRALGQPETFDVAVRVWKLDRATAGERYSELLTTLPDVKEVNEIADRSMRATEQQIYGVGFLDSGRGVVVLMTCGQSQCKSIDMLVALGRKAHENVRRIVPEAAAGEGQTPAQPAAPRGPVSGPRGPVSPPPSAPTPTSPTSPGAPAPKPSTPPTPSRPAPAPTPTPAPNKPGATPAPTPTPAPSKPGAGQPAKPGGGADAGAAPGGAPKQDARP
jgi:hypothetical protein